MPPPSDDGSPRPLSVEDAALVVMVNRTRRSPGPDTAAIVGRLAAREPGPPPAPPPALPGLTDLVEVGRGGMGIVYRAREPRLDRLVAVKVLSNAAAPTPEGRSRAEREATLLTRIVHPNVVQILYVTDVAGAPAIVMEWIDGPSLDDRVAAGKLPAAEAATLVAGVGRGVAALHARGIIHRDIKPANVLLAAPGDGRGPMPKLVDFGLARPGEDPGPAVTRDGIAVGTPSFMAPEQTGLDPSLGRVGTAADIHALGGLLYWLLSGAAPFDAGSTAESLRRAAAGEVRPLALLVPGVPADLATIAGKCLARRPEDRYASAAALVEDLDRFLDGRTILARPAGPVERLSKWARRRPAPAALVATGLVAALALAGGTLYHLRRLQTATAALVASHGRVLEAQGLARRSFERLTDAAAERFLARGAALDDADRDHLRQIRDEYCQWPLEPEAATAERFKAAGLARVAELFDRLHWLPDALEAAREAIGYLDGIETRGAPTADDESLRQRVQRLEIAILARTGRIDDAAAVARDAVDRLVNLGAAGDPAAGRRLAVAWGDLANAEAMASHRDESLALHAKAVDLLDQLLAAAPDDVDLACLALPVFYNAAISPVLTDGAIRRRRLERLVAVAGESLERFAVQRDVLGRGLLLGLAALAHLDLAAGEPAAALTTVRRRAAACRTLLDEMPDSDHFLGESVGAAGQACACLMELGRPGEAEADVAAAVALAERSVAEQPAIAGRTRILVTALVARATLEAATLRRDAALATQRRILAVLAPWIGDREPGRETPADFLAAAERARGAIESLANDRAAAVD
ncbi:MAG: serine/threonine protein kinase [Planctomycetes bacterium]|nr:serine/threonine protein kinase [Planctomycetota bacterium]